MTVQRETVTLLDGTAAAPAGETFVSGGQYILGCVIGASGSVYMEIEVAGTWIVPDDFRFTEDGARVVWLTGHWPVRGRADAAGAKLELAAIDRTRTAPPV